MIAQRVVIVFMQLHDEWLGEEIALAVQPEFGHFDGGDGLIDPDPAPIQPIRDGNRRAAADKRVKHRVALIRGACDDAF